MKNSSLANPKRSSLLWGLTTGLLLSGSLLNACPHPSPKGPMSVHGPGSSRSTDSLGTTPKVIYSEGILAQVGDKIILRSELESEVRNTLNQENNTANPDESNVRCMVFEQMILGKMLQLQAELDSLEISSEEIENQLDRRIRYFAGMLGGQEKIE
ncbi:MAG: SurA N-terminal domain-containing protein, partial [Bacteroidota bacterium]